MSEQLADRHGSLTCNSYMQLGLEVEQGCWQCDDWPPCFCWTKKCSFAKFLQANKLWAQAAQANGLLCKLTIPAVLQFYHFWNSAFSSWAWFTCYEYYSHAMTEAEIYEQINRFAQTALLKLVLMEYRFMQHMAISIFITSSQCSCRSVGR